MQLYLRHDLVKAQPGSIKPPSAGAPTPAPATPSAPAAPAEAPTSNLSGPQGGPGGKAAGQPPEGFQPCSVGGGDQCLQAGGNGAEMHKVGGSIERRHSEYRAKMGAGASQEPTEKPADKVTPEEAKKTARESAEAAHTIDPNLTQGVTSVDPKDYPEDSNPVDHYRVAEMIEKIGGNNASAKELAEGHRKIAQQRSERLDASGHEQLADQLKQQGLTKQARYHEREAGEQRAKQNETLATVEKMGQEVEDRASAREAVEKVGEDVEARAAQRKEEGRQAVSGAMERKQQKDQQREAEQDKTVAAAEKMAEDVESRTEQRKEEGRQAVSGAMERKKQKDEERLKEQDESVAAVEKMGQDIEEKKKKREEDPYEAAKQKHEEHKKEVDQQHSDAVAEHKKMTREYEQHQKKGEKLKQKIEEHKAKEPATFGEPKPSMQDFEDRSKFESAMKEWKQKKEKADKEKKQHKEKLQELKQQHQKHKADAPEKPGKPPKHPGYDEEPTPEQFGGKTPDTDVEHAKVSDHTSRASQLHENVSSHLEGNEELTDQQKEKLQRVQDALKEHTELEKVPTDQHAKELKELEKLSGEHGKKAHESAKEEEVQPPETEMDKLRLEDHKQQAQDLHDTLQQHIEQLEAQGEDQKADHLRSIQEQAKTHIENDMMPGKEEEQNLKELHKIAGEYSKPPKQQTTEEGEAKGKTTKQTTEKTKTTGGRSRSWAAAFGRGRQFGSSVGRAALTGSAGAIGADVLDAAGGGVVSVGESLLSKPSRVQERAQKEAQKEDKSVDKGLYLSLDADLDLIKAVNPPNVGTTTESDRRMKTKMNSSYAKQPVGVMGQSGVAMEDDPDVGKEWKHSEEDSVSAEVEEELEDQKKKKEDEEETEKSYNILKSLRSSIEDELSVFRYNQREVEFLRDVLGYPESDINKGLVRITGRERAMFQEWLQDNLNKSVSSMLGGYFG